MKRNILIPQILINLLIFGLFLIISEQINAQDIYSLNLRDTTTYNTGCGKVNASQWSVKNDSCVLYTPYFRKETPGCGNVTYSFRINQSGNGDANDLAYVQVWENNVWTTDTTIMASTYSSVHYLSGTINMCYGDVIRLRVILKTNSKTEFWAIFSGNITLSGSFTTYSSYPPPLDGQLPVEITAYKIKCIKTGSVFSWTTASEVNNDFFEVEKTEDLLNWRIVTTISGAFNSNQEIQYSAIDTNMVPDKVTYYRLKQTDFDGQYKYFDVLSILCSFQNNTLDIIGLNVSSSHINLIIETNGFDPVQIMVSDLNGKTIVQKEITPAKGANVVSLDTPGLQSGIYIANIYQNGISKSSKVFLTGNE